MKKAFDRRTRKATNDEQNLLHKPAMNIARMSWHAGTLTCRKISVIGMAALVVRVIKAGFANQGDQVS